MDQNLIDDDLIESGVSEDIPLRNTNNEREKSKKCNQCDYASSEAGTLRTHLKTHSGENTNECDQCDYASSRAGHLRIHLKIHRGQKSDKCNQCDYASSRAGNLMKHIKIHVVKSQTNAANVIMHALIHRRHI